MRIFLNLVASSDESFTFRMNYGIRCTKKVLVSSINNFIIFPTICTLEPFQHTNFYLNKIHRWLIVHFKCFTQITQTHSTHLIHKLKSIFDEIELRRIRIRMGFFFFSTESHWRIANRLTTKGLILIIAQWLIWKD